MFSDAWGHIINFDSYLIAFAVILAVMVVFVTVQKKICLLPALYFAVGFAACMYVRYAMDSSAYTMYGILLMILSFTMYSFDFGHLRKMNTAILQIKAEKLFLFRLLYL